MGAPARPVTDLPVALTIAGSDSGGGAGIQADLKVFFALRCHGASALTALTAQNTVGVRDVLTVGPEFVAAQIDAVAADLTIAAAKTGMLATAEIIDTVAKSIEAHGIDRLVVDPVFVSKHGDSLLQAEAVDALRTRLVPLAEIVTPNLSEAAGLASMQVQSLADMREAAARIGDLGPRAVLVKGGHLGSERAVDVLWHLGEVVELDAPRYETNDTHGTGCALSAAITARLARGAELHDAVGDAKDFVTGAIERGLRLGRGYGPVNPGWDLGLYD